MDNVLSPRKIRVIRARPNEQTVNILRRYVATKNIPHARDMRKKDLCDVINNMKKTKGQLVASREGRDLNVTARESKISVIKRMSTNRIKRRREFVDLERGGYPVPVVWKYHDFVYIKKYRISWARHNEGNIEGMYNVLTRWLRENQRERLRYVVFFIYNANANNRLPHRYITVQAGNLDLRTLASFTESVEALNEADDNAVGSDIVHTANERIDFGKFDVSTTPRVNLAGKGMSIYKSLGINGGRNGTCTVKCLKHILDVDYEKKDCEDLEKLKAICLKENIDLLLSTIKADEQLFVEDDTKLLKVPDVKHPRRKIMLYPMNIQNIEKIYIVKHEEPAGTILVDFENKHADIIENNDVQFNNVYFAGEKLYIVNGNEYEEIEKYTIRNIKMENTRITCGANSREKDENGNEKEENPNNLRERADVEKSLFNYNSSYGGIRINRILKKGQKTQASEKALEKPVEVKKAYVFIDLETVCDFSNEDVVIPISMQLTHVIVGNHIKNGNSLENKEWLHSIRTMKGRTSEDVKIYHGTDCVKHLANLLTEGQSHKSIEITMVTYNGARFDHYILYRELSRYMHGEVHSEFFVRNELLSFQVGVHKVFDLCKHTNMPLKDACAGYGIDAMKGEISFSAIQAKYDELEYDDFLDYLANDKQFNEYSKNDVVCLSRLMGAYLENLCILGNDGAGDGIFCEFVNNIFTTPTYGGMVNRVFNSGVKKNKIILPLIEDKQIFDDLRDSRTGGRVQLFNKPCKIEEKIVSLDVSGAYAFIMAVAKTWYGCGEIVNVDKYEDMPKKKIGFFYCSDIDQSNRRVKIVPHKSKLGNDWKSKKPIEKRMLLSTVKIDDMKKANCVLSIHNGFYFTDRVKGCVLFEFILKLLKEKSEQDILNEMKDEKYNPAIRQMIKSFMLVMSGKLAEGLYLNKTCIVSNEEFKEMDKLGNISLLDTIDTRAVIDVPVDVGKALKSSKPIYLSTLIYDYSHRYMNRMYGMFKYRELIATSTDSLKIRHSDFLKVQEKLLATPLPHWPEVEKYDPRYKTAKMLSLSNRDKVVGSFIDEYADKDYKYGLFFKKGIYCLFGEKDKNITYSGLNLKNVPIENTEDFKNMTSDDLYEYYHTHKTIGDDPETFFNKYFETREAHILCQHITRQKKTVSLHIQTMTKTITY